MKEPRRLVFIAILVAQGVILGLIESAFPAPFPFAPGAKIGLPNLITVISLYTMPLPETILLMITRLFLTTFLSGTASTFIYSAAGAVLSFIGMVLVKKCGGRFVSIIGISAMGGFMHNLGQLFVASWMSSSWYIMLYLPVLAFFGILAGIANGLAGNYLLEHIRTLKEFRSEHEWKNKV